MKFATPFFVTSLVSRTALKNECCPNSLARTIVQSWPGPADLPVQNLFPRHLALGGGLGGPVRAFSFSGGPVQNISLVLTKRELLLISTRAATAWWRLPVVRRSHGVENGETFAELFM
jgi:hypothetical protein